MRRLAILGGTFNPPHRGHLQIAAAAQTQFSLDLVFWVPTYAPAYRRGLFVADFQHRISMVQRSIAPYPSYQLSTVEQDLPPGSYTIDTFQALQNQHPNSQWFYIIGLDAFQRLPQWYRRQDLIPQCVWLVAPRSLFQPITPLQATASLQGSPASQAVASAQPALDQTLQQLQNQNISVQWHWLDLIPNPISSSLVRRLWGDRQPIDSFVSLAVRDYIEQHQVYSQNPSNRV